MNIEEDLLLCVRRLYVVCMCVLLGEHADLFIKVRAHMFSVSSPSLSAETRLYSGVREKCFYLVGTGLSNPVANQTGN